MESSIDGEVCVVWGGERGSVVLGRVEKENSLKRIAVHDQRACSG